MVIRVGAGRTPLNLPHIERASYNTYWDGWGKADKAIEVSKCYTERGGSRPPKITPQERSERIHVDRVGGRAKRRSALHCVWGSVVCGGRS